MKRWGSSGNNHGLTALINHKFAPTLIGEGPRDINRLWEMRYNGVRDHYALRDGFKAVKMRVGVIDGPVRNSVARVRAAREALGPDIGLMCDAHGTYTVADAKQFCRLVEDCDLTWFEDLVTADDKRGLAEVRASIAVPIAVGESEFTRFDFLGIAQRGGADIFQPDLAICGGISEAMRIGAIASAFNLRLAPHLWSGACRVSRPAPGMAWSPRPRRHRPLSRSSIARLAASWPCPTLPKSLM